MRALLGYVLGLAFCCGLSAGDKKGEKIDAEKLVGKWCPKEAAVFTIEFTKDGKVKLVVATADGKVKKGEGTYKIDGNKVTATVKLGGEERTVARTISKLTDTELVGTDEEGRETTLVRLKGK